MRYSLEELLRGPSLILRKWVTNVDRVRALRITDQAGNQLTLLAIGTVREEEDGAHMRYGAYVRLSPVTVHGPGRDMILEAVKRSATAIYRCLEAQLGLRRPLEWSIVSGTASVYPSSRLRRSGTLEDGPALRTPQQSIHRHCPIARAA